MDERELLKERFKSAVSSAVKAISENYDLEIKLKSNSTINHNLLIKMLVVDICRLANAS